MNYQHLAIGLLATLLIGYVIFNEHRRSQELHDYQLTLSSLNQKLTQTSQHSANSPHPPTSDRQQEKVKKSLPSWLNLDGISISRDGDTFAQAEAVDFDYEHHLRESLKGNMESLVAMFRFARKTDAAGAEGHLYVIEQLYKKLGNTKFLEARHQLEIWERDYIDSYFYEIASSDDSTAGLLADYDRWRKLFGRDVDDLQGVIVQQNPDNPDTLWEGKHPVSVRYVFSDRILDVSFSPEGVVEALYWFEKAKHESWISSSMIPLREGQSLRELVITTGR